MANAPELVGAAYKDSSPMKTVEKIKGILAANGISVREQWHDTKVPYCYSLTVYVEGTAFSTNGKGLSREFTLASAYGELMERLQLGFIGRRATQKDGVYSMNDSQDIALPVSQLQESNSDWYQKLADKFYDWNGTKVTVNEILMQYADENQNVQVTPYFNLTDGEVAYIPSQMRKLLYTSNGCAAGNTMEETIVQAIGEVVERYYRMRIIKDNICVPEIPDEVLQQYKTAYDIITYVRQQGYKVFVKDCSLGEKFPVVCVCYIHEKTGNYHTHFGAYPDFEIALVRALTETFQGRNVDSFAIYNDFLYNTDEKTFIHNMSTELVYGYAERTPDFFVGNNKYAYNPQVGFKGKNNKELLKECVEFFKEQGYQILVRDGSCLGFPTCQIIIPGYSETAIHRLFKKTDDGRYLSHAVSTLRNPTKATMPDMLGCLMHVQKMKALMPRGTAGFLAGTKIMARLSQEDEAFLMSASMAYVHYALGQYAAASQHIKGMMACKDGKDSELLICIKRYVDLKVAGYSDDQIRTLIEMFHTPETAALFFGYVDKHENPLAEFVLHCDLTACDTCRIREKCCQKTAQYYIDMINEKTAALDFDGFANHLKTLV